MAKQSALGGRLGNVIKNSSLGLINNVLPSVLRFFSRYIFIIYFGDALLGVNSLFTDVVLLFSFAEMGIFSAVSFFLFFIYLLYAHHTFMFLYMSDNLFS